MCNVYYDEGKKANDDGFDKRRSKAMNSAQQLVPVIMNEMLSPHYI